MECKLSNTTIHYEVHGEGRPIFVLPGWTAPSSYMAHRVEPFFEHVQGWKRIYIDPPGHGKSPGPDWIMNMDQILAVILEAIDTLAGQDRFCVYGSSAGAYQARGVIREWANRIDGAALIVPLIIAENSRRNVPDFQIIIDTLKGEEALSEEEEYFLSASIIRSPNWLEAVRGMAQAVGGQYGDLEFLDAIRSDPEKYALSFDVDDLPDPFSGPTLIVAGRQDSVVGYKDCWKILDNYPRASFVVLDRRGHFMEESVGLMQVLVAEWLDRVEEFSNTAE